jgi:peptidyl-prolyl cis-trans isomerase D
MCRSTPFLKSREVQVARFSTAGYATRDQPDRCGNRDLLQGQPALFQAPEQANIEYLVLDLDAVRKSITSTRQDLKTYYEQNAARLAGQEERRASHILITASKSALRLRIARRPGQGSGAAGCARKAPDSFADLARKNSQDPGSAPGRWRSGLFCPGRDGQAV